MAPTESRDEFGSVAFVVESFFHTLKAEFFRGKFFASVRELRQGLAGTINHFYNRQRMHSGIGHHSPEEYEKIAA